MVGESQQPPLKKINPEYLRAYVADPTDVKLNAIIQAQITYDENASRTGSLLIGVESGALAKQVRFEDEDEDEDKDDDEDDDYNPNLVPMEDDDFEDEKEDAKKEVVEYFQKNEPIIDVFTDFDALKGRNSREKLRRKVRRRRIKSNIGDIISSGFELNTMEHARYATAENEAEIHAALKSALSRTGEPIDYAIVNAVTELNCEHAKHVAKHIAANYDASEIADEEHIGWAMGRYWTAHLNRRRILAWNKFASWYNSRPCRRKMCLLPAPPHPVKPNPCKPCEAAADPCGAVDGRCKLETGPGSSDSDSDEEEKKEQQKESEGKAEQLQEEGDNSSDEEKDIAFDEEEKKEQQEESEGKAEQPQEEGVGFSDEEEDSTFFVDPEKAEVIVRDEGGDMEEKKEPTQAMIRMRISAAKERAYNANKSRRAALVRERDEAVAADVKKKETEAWNENDTIDYGWGDDDGDEEEKEESTQASISARISTAKERASKAVAASSSSSPTLAPHKFKVDNFVRVMHETNAIDAFNNYGSSNVDAHIVMLHDEHPAQQRVLDGLRKTQGNKKAQRALLAPLTVFVPRKADGTMQPMNNVNAPARNGKNFYKFQNGSELINGQPAGPPIDIRTKARPTSYSKAVKLVYPVADFSH